MSTWSVAIAVKSNRMRKKNLKSGAAYAVRVRPLSPSKVLAPAGLQGGGFFVGRLMHALLMSDAW